MVRRIIEIDQEKCNGCGACAAACHEGAIGMVDGKARLLRAFPRMRSDRYAATLEEVRSWLRENLQSDPAEK